MLQLITPASYDEFADELAEMHRLRCRVFNERLGWNVQVRDGLEIDEYDSLHPIYLLLRGSSGGISGCVRLLPTIGPTMLRDTFPSLLHGQPMRASPAVWESSRFALDVTQNAPKAEGGMAVETYELFAGLVEFGLARQMRQIVTVTDTRIERILRRAAWPLERIGPPLPIGGTQAVAGFLEVSRAALDRLRAGGGFRGPVLWSPVAPTP